MSLADAARSMSKAMDELAAGLHPPRLLVFISYTHLDRPLIGPLRDFLEARGYEVWWDDHIDIGDQIDENIIAALDAAMAVVVVWSDNSIKSHWVKWEANRGLKQRKLVPLATPGLDLEEIRPPFNGLSTLRLENESGLLNALHRIVSRNRRAA